MNFIDKTLGLFGYQRSKMIAPRHSYIFGQDKQPLYIDTSKPYDLYNSIPQLKTVVQKKALMFSNMEIKHINKTTGEEVIGSKYVEFLQNPNVSQSLNDFLQQYCEQLNIYGNQFMRKNVPLPSISDMPISLWNISPTYLNPVVSGKIFDQIKIEDIILHYEFRNGSVNKKYESKEILYSKINDLDNPVIGASPLIALQKSLSNIGLAYDYRNVIMKNMGLGILANNSKDSIGAMPLKDEERTRLENNFRERHGAVGDDKMKFILTEANLKWQPTSYPTKDLLLFEEVDANFNLIIDCFGLNSNLFANKSATFENVKNAMVQVYQDTIIPEADKFMQALTKFLNLPNNEVLIASYDHLSILKQTTNYNDVAPLVSMLNQAVTSSLLTPVQATSILQNELGKYFNVGEAFKS